MKKNSTPDQSINYESNEDLQFQIQGKVIKKNFSFLFVAETLIRILTFVMTVMAAQFYGPERFGVYTLALSVSALFETIFNLGINTVFMQRVSGTPGKISQELGLFLPLKLLINFISIIFFTLFIFVMQKNGETTYTLLLSGIYTNIFSIITFLWCCFDAKQKMEYTAINKLIKFGIIFSLGLIFILQKLPIYFLMYAFITGGIVSFIVTGIIIKKTLTTINLRNNFFEWKEIMKQGLPIAISGTFVFIYSYLDTIIISFTKGESAVGMYQTSYKIIGTIFILGTLINQAYFPSLIKTFQEAPEKLSKIYEKSLKSSLFWSIPSSLGGFILAERIILFVYGKDYIDGIMPFKILIFNCIIYFVSSSMTNLLYATKDQKKIMWIFFCGAAFNTISNLLIIPWYGINGAAATTLLAEIIVLIGISNEAKKRAEIRLLELSMKPLMSGAIMSIVLLNTHFESILITVALGGGVYMGSYFVLEKIQQQRT